MTRRKKVTKIQELVYELKVGDVMKKDVIAVTPETSMSELREILRSERISGVPVMNGKKMVGIISIEDLIKHLADRTPDCSIEEKMTHDVEILYSDEALTHAIERLETTGLGRFPVLDRENRKLIGVITKGDIIEGLLKKLEVDYHEEEIHRYRASHIFEDIVADKTTLIFQYDVRGGNLKKAGESASGIKRTLGRLGIHPQILRRVAIVAYEAEMNIVIFTGGGGITVKVEPRQILLEATDSGPGIPDINKAMQPGFSTAPNWVRELGFGAGMGLCNIKNCSDKMKLKSAVGEGTYLEVKIALKKPG
jgi:CBS domain-containing protein/anti-sigma regulatory factor (Ser/Thr protein kinase)